ncbi:SDR family oxidoreductase [Chryseobacterium gossypii]|uniref:SDR family oxidoreductase n=1 Tax=Chryseobacterium gossypii TaxID=3231602 RepID=UPI003523B13C
MKTVLITGANKSIGLEAAKQLSEKGFFVYLGSRNPEKGEEAVKALRDEGFENVKAIEIDVTDSGSVTLARQIIEKEQGKLDVLINNAGISGGIPQLALEADIERFRNVYETNVFGVVRVTQAFIDLLKSSPEPRIVNVSSSQGSLTLAADPANKYYNHKGAIYQSSKSALNMYTIILAYELRDTRVKVNAVDPGFTKTDFNDHRGTGTVQDAAARIVKYALIGQDGPTGKYFSEEMNPETGEIPW